DVPHARRFFEQLLGASEQEVSTQFRHRHKSGAHRHLELTGGNRLDDPSVRGLVINSRDITERRQAEEELRLVQNIVLAVSGSSDVNSALNVALQKICEATGWVLAQAWIPRADINVLESSPACYCTSAGLEEFRVQSQSCLF